MGRLTALDRTTFFQFLERSEEERLLGLEDDRRQAGAKEHRLNHDPVVVLAEVGQVDQIRLAVEERDVRGLGREDVSDLVANDVDDRLHVQLLSKRLLDAVDNRQLGRALLQLLADFPLRNGLCR